MGLFSLIGLDLLEGISLSYPEPGKILAKYRGKILHPEYYGILRVEEQSASDIVRIVLESKRKLVLQKKKKEDTVLCECWKEFS
jgi:hypothetical protein